MKRNLLIAVSALGLAALAAPAFAQSATGTVGINGVVTSKCYTNGDENSTSFGSTNDIQLGEIDQSNGTIRADLAGGTAIGAATKTYTVTCTGVNNTIAVTAQAFKTGSGAPPSGSSNTINYTAEVDVGLAAGGSAPFTATPTTPLSATPIPSAISSSANNVTVKAYSFAPTAGAQLVAGTYYGEIDITIAPAS